MFALKNSSSMFNFFKFIIVFVGRVYNSTLLRCQVLKFLKAKLFVLNDKFSYEFQSSNFFINFSKFVFCRLALHELLLESTYTRQTKKLESIKTNFLLFSPFQ